MDSEKRGREGGVIKGEDGNIMADGVGLPWKARGRKVEGC